MVFSTKGIVLKTTRYGDTSIITQIYTELFGIQSYLVKGVYRAGKRKPAQNIYFQPAAILSLEVYHQPQKQLQFIKEFSWAYVYNRVLTNVKRHSVTLYIVELLQHCLQQPEAHVELFYLTESVLQLADTGSEKLMANLPIYYTLQTAAILGFQIQGNYTAHTPLLDLQEGYYTENYPQHVFVMEAEAAQAVSQFLQIPEEHINTIENIILNHGIRRNILQSLQTFFQLHISGYGKLKSLDILQEILSA